MAFPIKKRITTSTAPSGLDILSAAIDSHPERAPSAHSQSNSEGTIVTTSTAPEECSSSTSDNDGETYSATTEKRAKTFPEILMEIISNPDYVHIVGWLPHGKSFAIHDPSQFSSVILPKYFRRVIFRSFIRKLNRWGFRSVKRSVSGFDHTFEHKYFCRDDPTLIAKLFCKSNPSSKVATKKASATYTVSPSNSAASVAPALLSQVPQQAAQQSFMNSRSRHNDEFQAHLSNELMLRELQQRRQVALMQLVHQMPMVEVDDIMSQYVADKWQQIRRSRQQQQFSDEYGRPAGL
mmetsp:Transcript_32775/g.68920  ORF Transcript_32775/g.68920 Transcript_32775/m.68920 type:complete len:294 (+) Transcript_32775:70-951(+)